MDGWMDGWVMTGEGEGGGVRIDVLWDADVDVVLMLCGVGIWRCLVVSLVEEGSCRDAAGWVVEFVESRSGVGGELAGVDAPVDDFRVGVSKGTSPSRGGGCVESAHAVGVEGCQWCVGVFDLARCVGESALRVGLGCCI